jgi:hypothetical protein
MKLLSEQVSILQCIIILRDNHELPKICKTDWKVSKVDLDTWQIGEKWMMQQLQKFSTITTKIDIQFFKNFSASEINLNKAFNG